MSSLPGQPFRWSPRTCTDSLITGDQASQDMVQQVENGAMAALSNLVPDPTSMDLWVPRPAAIKKIDFTTLAGFGTLGPSPSALHVIGDYAFGFIPSTSGSYSGRDIPWMYNLLSGAFVTISGITTANVPTAAPTTGAWTPPSLEHVGVYVVMCHPGFDGATHYVGWLNISNPASPTWSSGNTAINGLPSVPVSVAQFSGRAYYLCNPAGLNPSAILSDSLDPTTRTNATYVLTFGDNLALIAVIGMPLANQLGGVIQALLVFKENNIYQITGDPTSSNLYVNTLNYAVGTLSPNSLCVTPTGIAFVATDGLRIIDAQGQLSNPIGYAGSGVTVPFQQAVIPSRIAAACNATTIRITTQNGALTGTPYQEWCYDFNRKVWYGPHTFPYGLIAAWGLSFIGAPVGVAGVWKSDLTPISTSTYSENGATLTWKYQTALMPSQQDGMCNYSIVESQLWAAFDANSNLYSVLALNENGVSYMGCQITAMVTAGGIWGSGIWGQMLWGGLGQALAPRRLKWPQPLVFTRLSLQVVGTSAAGVKLGAFHARVRNLGYVPNQ